MKGEKYIEQESKKLNEKRKTIVKEAKELDDLLVKLENIKKDVFDSPIDDFTKELFSELKTNIYYKRDKLRTEAGELMKQIAKLRKKYN